MRIMFVIPRMNGGGAERVVANLANSFSRKNKIMICTLVSNESFYDIDNNNVDFISAGYSINRKNKITTLNSYRKFFLKSLKFIKGKIKEFDPDCIISFLVETDILTYLATINNKKIVNIYSERNDPTRRNIFTKLILKHVYKSADLFVCQSKKVSDYYKFIPNEKKVVISNPVDFSKIPLNIAKENNLNIVSIGRLTEQKNFELLINSFILSINSISKDSKLIIYGEGKLREKLEKIILDNKMEERIFLPGAKRNVLELINGSALYITSSDYEGFPNSLLEAIAIGLPVISTDFYTGVAGELIKKDNGIVVPTGNGEELSKAIVEIMNNKKKRQIYRKNNIELSKKYDVETISSIWMNNIKKVIDKKNKC